MNISNSDLHFFVVCAENEDFQGYHQQQTEGATVTTEWLLKEEIITVHGTATIPTENIHQHSAITVNAKSVGTALFHTTPPHGRTKLKGASAVIASVNSVRFVSRDWPDLLVSTPGNTSGRKSHTKPDLPLISNYERVVFSSTQAGFESMMNSTLEPESYLTTGMVKPSDWLHVLLGSRREINTVYYSNICRPRAKSSNAITCPSSSCN